MSRNFAVEESDALYFNDLMSKEEAWTENDQEEAMDIVETYLKSKECMLELLSLCNFGLREEARTEIMHKIENQINDLS